MKIHTRTATEKVPISDLEPGDCFQSHGEAYMLCNRDVDIHTPSGIAFDFVAVRLTDGTLLNFISLDSLPCVVGRLDLIAQEVSA